MAVMVVVGAMLTIGVTLSLAWGGIGFRSGAALFSAQPLPVDVVIRRFARGFAVAIVGGFWTGLLVTGPAVRLIMRLLAVTAGDSAQGRTTEARATIGEISVDGTIGLFIFGGLFTALGSGLLFVAVHSLLPAGRLGGAVLGASHFMLFATVFDPLRPDNVDFDLVRPNWLAILTFAAASLLHGVAITAFTNRFSHQLSVDPSSKDFLRAGAALAPPLLFVLVSVIGVLTGLLALVVVLLATRVPLDINPTRSKTIRRIGRIIVAAAVCISLPRTVADLADIADRGAAAIPDEHASPRSTRPQQRTQPLPGSRPSHGHH